MATNEFAKMSKLVSDIVTRYRSVREECGFTDKDWHSRSIEFLAKPFLDGHFTLVVVGKVSSGKSTFINALLGCKDLLPTGHDQTTCGITFIEYGEVPEVKITFGDGREVIIKEEIIGQIKSYVSIPEKYHNLPVNNIDDMILGGYNFERIWEVREQLEEETLCSKIDRDLLKDYVSHRSKKDIAVEVRIKYPFNEELKGWRVIDTPGIGAIGGIETRTRQLLAMQKKDGSREVDAIIFLQNGSQTLDQTDSKRFVKEQLENFTESDKHRLFYVLTHSSHYDFRKHKEGKMEFVRQNYGDKINVLTYADSLLYLFLNQIQIVGFDLKNCDDEPRLPEWTDEEWESVMSIISSAKRYLKDTGDSANQENLMRILVEWSHFEELKSEINRFAKEEKRSTLRKLINLISADYLGFIKCFEEDKRLVDGDLDEINKGILNTKKKNEEYNRIFRELDKKTSKKEIHSKFDFIEAELRKFEVLTSIPAIRTSITNLFDSVLKAEKKLFQEIIQQYYDFFSKTDYKDLVLESIDFGEIERKATPKDKDPYITESTYTNRHFCGKEKEVEVKYDKEKKEQEKIREFKALALRRAREARDKFLEQVDKKNESMRNDFVPQLKGKLESEKKHLEELTNTLNDREQFKATNDLYIENARAASKELIKLSDEYGV
jgi:hypothetical protein